MEMQPQQPSTNLDGLIGGQNTFLGLRQSELPPELAREEMQVFVGGLQKFEEKTDRISEQAAKFIVMMNAGGITVSVGILTTLISIAKAEIEANAAQLVPGILAYVIGLTLCGAVFVRYARALEGESAQAFKDAGQVARNEISISHAVMRMMHRRSSSGKPNKPLLVWAYWCFVIGAVLTVLGVAWPYILDVGCALLQIYRIPG